MKAVMHDQRGELRPFGAVCDIGAAERVFKQFRELSLNSVSLYKLRDTEAVLLLNEKPFTAS
jgi:hypothetical protein